MRYILILAIISLSGCKENSCGGRVISAETYQASFDHCMDKAASISHNNNHDNTYDTIQECQSFAMRIDTAKCYEAHHE